MLSDINNTPLNTADLNKIEDKKNLNTTKGKKGGGKTIKDRIHTKAPSIIKDNVVSANLNTKKHVTPPFPIELDTILDQAQLSKAGKERLKFFLIKTFTTYPTPHQKNTLQKELDKIENGKNSGQKYLLVRGATFERLVKMAYYRSAGNLPADANALPPSEEEAKAQVGEHGDSPEFTFILDKALAFAKRGVCLIVEVDGKYLTKGSVSEGGWVAAHSAPVSIKGWFLGDDIGYAFMR